MDIEIVVAAGPSVVVIFGEGNVGFIDKAEVGSSSIALDLSELAFLSYK